MAGFNQSLANVTLPQGLQSLIFGNDFNQSLLGLLPSSLEKLCLGSRFSHNLEDLQLPNLLWLDCQGVLVSFV